MTPRREPEAMPLVSVLMSVYNGAPYLVQAIDSVLGQELGDFEFIIVDDASTDGSAAIITAAAARDGRIRVLRNDCNIGLARSLNRALSLARGKYYARQDADDVSLPGRFARQLALLESDPALVLVGSSYRVIDREGQVLSVEEHPLGDLAIRWRLVLHNAFCHSSVMLRGDILRRHSLYYDESLVYAQDYELWSRFAGYGKMANVAEPLVSYRVHDEIQRPEMFRRQQEIANGITAGNLSRLGLALGEREVALLRASEMGLPVPEGEELHCRQLLLRVMSRFVALHPGAAAELAPLRIRLVQSLVKKGGRLPEVGRLALGFFSLGVGSFLAVSLAAFLSRAAAFVTGKNREHDESEVRRHD